MKVRLQILLVLFTFLAKVQPVLAQADSVCASNPVANYHVNGLAGSTFVWNTQGNGTIVSGQGNDSVVVRWTNDPGTYGITVKEISAGGCEGILQMLTVIVYQPRSTTLKTICTSQLPYSWNNNMYNTAGTYTMILTSSAGCDSLARLVLTVDQRPVRPVFLNNSFILCPGDTILLNPGIFYSYVWQDLSTQPVFAVTQDGTYQVTVSNSTGCTASASALVKIAPGCEDIYFPNAITPNGDGLNDAFGPLGNLSFVSNYNLSVYNRYGELVFQSTNPYQRWNGMLKGALQVNSNLVWQATYSYKGRVRKLKSGNITVIW